MAKTTDEADQGGIGEVETVCAEIVAELREMAEAHRDMIADAARWIAHRLANGLTPPMTDPVGHELAVALGRIGGVSGEVDTLLEVPVAASRAAVGR